MYAKTYVATARADMSIIETMLQALCRTHERKSCSHIPIVPASLTDIYIYIIFKNSLRYKETQIEIIIKVFREKYAMDPSENISAYARVWNINEGYAQISLRRSRKSNVGQERVGCSRTPIEIAAAILYEASIFACIHSQIHT